MLRYKILNIQTQADPPEPEHEHRQEVPGVREDVRQHAGPLHARPDPQSQPQVQHLWQSFLQTLASQGPPQVITKYEGRKTHKRFSGSH